MTRAEIENEFAYQFQRVALVAESVCCLIAAGTLALVYKEPPYALVVALIVLSCVCGWLWLRVLPFVEGAGRLDRIAITVFGGASICNMISAASMEHNSPISCGLISVGTAFAFRSGRVYAAFVLSSILGQILVRFLGPFPLDSDYLFLLILTPIFCITVYWAAQTLRRHTQTTRKQLQDHVEELNRERERRITSEKKLIHAQKMEGLGIVAAGIAHDFNNHLQAIGTFAELIELGDEPKPNASQIRTSAMNASEICKQMLAYAGKSAEQNQSPVDVCELLRESKPALGAGLSESIRLSFELPSEVPAVLSNAASLRDCFLNIVRNAIEACGDSGRVEVRVFQNSDLSSEIGWRVFGNDLPECDCVVVEVADSGYGMQSEVLERAFDPYFTTKPTGHGFGLATALGIVRGSGGAIRVHSDGYSGTIVQVVLPVTTAEDAVEYEKVAFEPDTMLAQRILLVDDDQTVLTSLSRLLELNDCDVTIAKSGPEALEILLARRGAFDLILMDYSMPEMSGIELLEQVRNHGINCPVVLCTGYAKEQVANREGVRPDGILNKPYRGDSLKSVLQAAMTMRQQQRSVRSPR